MARGVKAGVNATNGNAAPGGGTKVFTAENTG